MPELLLVLAVFAVIVWLVARLTSQTAGSRGLDGRDRAELLGLRALVDDLKETAWEHRELDSPLSTIIIDKIRTYDRGRRELGG